MNLRKELQRDARDHKYEHTETGVFFPRSRIAFDNYFDISVNGDEPSIAANMVVNQGLIYILGVALSTESKLSTWYMAPYAANVAPGSGWTAANFATNSTEFTNYAEGSRQTWTPGSISNMQIDNHASRATFTIGDGGQTTVWGAGLLSNSTKGGTSGTLIAAAQLSSSRSGLEEDDELSMGYRVQISDAS